MLAISPPDGPPPENGARRPQLRRHYTSFYQDDEDSKQAAMELFAKLDLDSSSFLEAFELKSTRDIMLGNAASFPESPETLSDLLSGIDLDKDGRVDEREWNEFMRSIYEIAGRRRFLSFTEALCKSAEMRKFPETAHHGHTFNLEFATLSDHLSGGIRRPVSQERRPSTTDKNDLSMLAKSSTIDRSRIYKRGIVGELSANAILSSHTPGGVDAVEAPAVSSTCPAKPKVGNDKTVQRRPSNSNVIRRRATEEIRPSPLLVDALPILPTSSTQENRATTALPGTRRTSRLLPNGKILAVRSLSPHPSARLNISGIAARVGHLEKKDSPGSQTPKEFSAQALQKKNASDPLSAALGKLAAKHSASSSSLAQASTQGGQDAVNEASLDGAQEPLNATILPSSQTMDHSTPKSSSSTTTHAPFPKQCDAAVQRSRSKRNTHGSETSMVSAAVAATKPAKPKMPTLGQATLAGGKKAIPIINVADKSTPEATAYVFPSIPRYEKSEHHPVDAKEPEEVVDDEKQPETVEREGSDLDKELAANSVAKDTQGSILELHVFSSDSQHGSRRQSAALLVPENIESWPEDLKSRERSGSFDLTPGARSRSPSMPCISEVEKEISKKGVRGHATTSGKASHRKDARSPEAEPEPEAPTSEFGERRSSKTRKRTPSDIGSRSHDPSRSPAPHGSHEPSRSPAPHAHDEKWLQRHLDKEMHLLTVDEVWEIMTNKEGGMHTHIDLSDVLEIFLTAKKQGLDVHFIDLVPQYSFEHWAPAEDLSGDEFLHLCTILQECDDMSSLTEDFVRDQMAPVRELCRTEQMKESVFERVDKEAALCVKQWRHLVTFLSLLMRIDVEYLLAQFAWILIGHFEMTDALAASMMLACSSRPPKKPHDFNEELNHVIDLDILYEGFAKEDLLRLCNSCGVIDSHGKKGLSTTKVSHIYTDCQSRMHELIASRCDAYKRRKGPAARASLAHAHPRSSVDVHPSPHVHQSPHHPSPHVHPTGPHVHPTGSHSPRPSHKEGHKDSHGPKESLGFTGRTEFSILVETIVRTLPNRAGFVSPLQFSLHLLQSTVVTE